MLTIDNAAIKKKLEMLSSAFDENQVEKKQLQKQLDDTLVSCSFLFSTCQVISCLFY